jgi:hypothetical protein
MYYFDRCLIFMDMSDQMDDFDPHMFTYEGQLYLSVDMNDLTRLFFFVTGMGIE